MRRDECTWALDLPSPATERKTSGKYAPFLVLKKGAAPGIDLITWPSSTCPAQMNMTANLGGIVGYIVKLHAANGTMVWAKEITDDTINRDHEVDDIAVDAAGNIYAVRWCMCVSVSCRAAVREDRYKEAP